MALGKRITNLGVTLLSSILLILVGIVYFMLTVWIIKIGSGWAGVATDGGTIVLTAGIVTAAALIGSAIQQ